MNRKYFQYKLNYHLFMKALENLGLLIYAFKQNEKLTLLWNKICLWHYGMLKKLHYLTLYQWN